MTLEQTKSFCLSYEPSDQNELNICSLVSSENLLVHLYLHLPHGAFIVFLAIILPFVLLYSLPVNLSLFLTFFFQASGVALCLRVSFFFTGVKYLAAFLGVACFGEESLSGILMSAVDVFMSEEILRSEVDMSTSSRLFSPKNS